MMTGPETSYVNELEDCCDDLNEWERGFVENMVVMRDRNRVLAINQADKLRELWEAHCK